MIVQICVGSSCHIKGAPDIVQMLQDEVEKNRLEDTVTLAGSFCTGRCNRVGVTVTVDDTVHTGLTRENFRDFFTEQILKPALQERQG